MTMYCMLYIKHSPIIERIGSVIVNSPPS